jgi:hypothetical protein
MTDLSMMLDQVRSRVAMLQGIPSPTDDQRHVLAARLNQLESLEARIASERRTISALSATPQSNPRVRPRSLSPDDKTPTKPTIPSFAKTAFQAASIGSLVYVASMPGRASLEFFEDGEPQLLRRSCEWVAALLEPGTDAVVWRGATLAAIVQGVTLL